MKKAIFSQKFLLFALITIGIGFILGIFYYLFLNGSIKADIAYTLSNINNFKYNMILKDMIIMAVLLITSFFLVGFPLSFLVFLYEGFSLGFVLTAWIANYFLKGLIFSLVYILIYRGISLFLIIVFAKKVFNIAKSIFKNFFKKDSSHLKASVVANFCNAEYIIVLTFLINIGLYFFSKPIFNFLSVLIK